MKVLQIASSDISFFCDQVRILNENGIDCDVLYSASSKKGVHKEGDELSTKVLNKVYGHNILYYSMRGGHFLPKVLKNSLANKYDIIHMNSGMVAPIGLLQPQRPIVTTLWGDDLLGNRLNGYQGKISKFCAKKSAATIVRSEEMRQALPCDAHIIPSGVDLEKFKPINRAEAVDRVNWKPDSKHVLFPYPRSQKKKRYSVAKEIVENVNGELDERVELQSIYGVEHERMYLYYSAADVMILPSLREGSPNTVKEAMACNLPVVSTDVGDVSMRLGPVSNSHVCTTDLELTEALYDVLKSNNRSDGRLYVEDVSLKRMGEKIIDIYEHVLDDK